MRGPGLEAALSQARADLDKSNLLAAYGTLRRCDPRHAHHMAAGARWLGVDRVPGLLYRLGAYPGLVVSNNSRDHVVVDLFAISGPQLMVRLDRYEGCKPGDPGSLYRRALVETGHGLWAWLYAYQGPVGTMRPLPGGNWCTAKPKRRT